MNILQYNLLDGCREGERFANLDRWIGAQSYDVIGLGGVDIIFNYK